VEEVEATGVDIVEISTGVATLVVIIEMAIATVIAVGVATAHTHVGA